MTEEAEEAAQQLLSRGGLAALATAGNSSAAAGAVMDSGDAPGRRIAADELLSGYKERAHSKKDRLASVHAGREDRGEFGSKSSRKKMDKTGGLSNKAKDKKKNMPVSARIAKARSRALGKRPLGNKGGRRQQRGKKAFKK